MPNFWVPSRYRRSHHSRRRSAPPGEASDFADLVDCVGNVWAVPQKVPQDADASAVSSAVLFAKPRLLIVPLLPRLDYWRGHRLTLVVTEV